MCIHWSQKECKIFLGLNVFCHLWWESHIFADCSGAPLSSNRLSKKQAQFTGERLKHKKSLWKWAEGEQRWVALVDCQSSKVLKYLDASGAISFMKCQGCKGKIKECGWKLLQLRHTSSYRSQLCLANCGIIWMMPNYLSMHCVIA